MNIWLERCAKIALMFWAIVTWATGYVFAPVMFAKFDKIQAGLNTGELLHATYVLSLLCALVLLMDVRVRFRQQLLHLTDLWLILGALFIVIVQYVGISPKMSTLKQTMLNNPADASAFMQWHGVSQVLYLVTSVLLAILVWRRLLK
ncbi:MAG: DUF4149 domain-containing protein [Burkholderiales bacterium]|nr:DUF4149 domain-containing protein [Burkholderiales bacterium]MCE1176267.1 DUF4149 domain-containing protein [Burkholderiales bacterium]